MALADIIKLLEAADTAIKGFEGLVKATKPTREAFNAALAASDDPLPRGGDDITYKEGQFSVARGRAGTIDQRVARIIKMARAAKRSARIQLLVAKTLNRKCGEKWCIDEKDHPAEIKAVFKMIRSKMRYMSDPRGVDTFRHPARSLDDFAGGDCDDYSSALAGCLEAAGYSTKLRVVALKPAAPTAYSHILVLVGLPQRAPTTWYPLDASVNMKMGWYPKERISGFKDFPVPP